MLKFKLDVKVAPQFVLLVILTVATLSHSNQSNLTMRILVEGDSLATAGKWPSLIASELKNSVEVIVNAVVNSYLQSAPPDTVNPISGSVLDRLHEISLDEIDILIVMAGVNDIHQYAYAKAGTPVPFMKNAVNKLASLNVDLVIFEVVSPGGWDYWNEERERYRLEFNSWLSKQPDITSVNIDSIVDRNLDGAIDKEFSDDGIHYNRKGNEVIAHHVVSFLNRRRSD